MWLTSFERSHVSLLLVKLFMNKKVDNRNRVAMLYIALVPIMNEVYNNKGVLWYCLYFFK